MKSASRKSGSAPEPWLSAVLDGALSTFESGRNTLDSMSGHKESEVSNIHGMVINWNGTTQDIDCVVSNRIELVPQCYHTVSIVSLDAMRCVSSMLTFSMWYRHTAGWEPHGGAASGGAQRITEAGLATGATPDAIVTVLCIQAISHNRIWSLGLRFNHSPSQHLPQ